MHTYTQLQKIHTQLQNIHRITVNLSNRHVHLKSLVEVASAIPPGKLLLLITALFY